MRKRLLLLGAFIGGMALAVASQARDTKLLLSIDEAMNSPTAKEELDPNIRFIFADSPHTAVTAEHGSYITNKKTNAFNKTDKEACQWVMLSALLSLQERVRSEGGNAVINIESYYKQQPLSSRTEYECHAGMLMAGVALRGDVVTLR